MRCSCCDTDERLKYDKDTNKFYCTHCWGEIKENYKQLKNGGFTFRDLNYIFFGEEQ